MSDYPGNMTLRPIDHWPGDFTRNRVVSKFSAHHRATLDLLTREVWNLGTGNRMPPSVLQVALREQDFRNDGMPQANAKPDHPGVILSIESAKGSLSFPCDRFTTWQDNLRAIALSLEALRRVDRYGITPNGEQYTGWQQLPAGAASQDTSAAELTIVSYADFPVGEHRSLQEAYREAKRKVHPDRHCGDHTHSDQLEAAADVLRAAGRLLDTPAAVRFISAEPLLGPIDLMRGALGFSYDDGTVIVDPHLDWVIVGGESGPKARPMHPGWARSLRDQCVAAGVPFHLKQWGEWCPLDSETRRADSLVMTDDGATYRAGDLDWPDGPRRGEAQRADFPHHHPTFLYRLGKKRAGRVLDGRTWDQYPGGEA